MEEDGFRIIVTPSQLGAMLAGGTVGVGRGGASGWTRAWGAAKLVFGALEELGAGALLLAPEPTTLTKRAGGALGVYGADPLQSGGRQLWSGRDTRTLTSEGTGALAKALGGDERTAGEIGEDVNELSLFPLLADCSRSRQAAGLRIAITTHDDRMWPAEGQQLT